MYRELCFKEITMETRDKWWITENAPMNSSWLKFSLEHFPHWKVYGKYMERLILNSFILSLSDWPGLPRTEIQLQNKLKCASLSFCIFPTFFHSEILCLILFFLDIKVISGNTSPSYHCSPGITWKSFFRQRLSFVLSLFRVLRKL